MWFLAHIYAFIRNADFVFHSRSYSMSLLAQYEMRFTMYTSDSVYLKFKEALKNELFKIKIDDFESAWCNGLANKTKFYELFFSGLASSMSLYTVYEQYRCDMTFIDEDEIPLVLIETENNHTTASLEISQLCGLNAPLKVLVISCDWFDSEREKWIPIWSDIIRKYNLAFPTNSKFCVVVGEWGRGHPCDDILRYYVVTMSNMGEVIEEIEWRIQT